MRRLLVLGIAVATIGCKRELEYHRLELPGFSIEVPRQVTWAGDPKTSYRTGQAQAKIGTRFVSVTWQAGEIATVDEMPGIAKATAAALPDVARMTSRPARSEKINGHDATRIDATIDVIDASFIDIACGKRSVMVAIASKDDLPAMRERMLRSFTCTPREVDEQAIAGAVPIGVDDPEVLREWALMPQDGVFTLSNGVYIAVFAEVARTALDGTALDKVLPSLFSAYGGQWKTSRREHRPSIGGEREVHFGTMTSEGQAMPAALSLWSCGRGGDMVMGLLIRIDGTDEADASVLTKVRCAKPGDAPLPLAPTPPEDLEDAMRP